MKFVEAAGVEPASKIRAQTGHSQVCQDLLILQNSLRSHHRPENVDPPHTMRVTIFGQLFLRDARRISIICLQGQWKPRDQAAIASSNSTSSLAFNICSTVNPCATVGYLHP